MSGIPGAVIAESLVREVLDRRAGRATLRVASSSMSPRIRAGDAIEIVRVSPRALLPGDVVVFKGHDAGLVVHRLIWRDRPLGQPTRIFTKGDAVGCLDRSTPVDRVLGRVERVVREEGRFDPTTSLDRIRSLWLAAGYGARRWVRRRRGQRAHQAGNLESR